MSWEMFKSILLSVLIVLSLFLTWNLWNFHSQFKPLEKAGYVQSDVSKHGKVSLNDTVYPLLAIFHEGGAESPGLNAKTSMKAMLNKVTRASYNHVKQQNGKNKNKFRQQVKKDSVSLVFPHAISKPLFQDMLHKGEKQKGQNSGLDTLDDDVMFDVISFHKTPAGVLAIFQNGHDTVATAKTNGLSYGDLHDFKKKTTDSFVSKDLADGPIQLPAESVCVKKISYSSYQWLDIDKFKSVLFDHPHEVLHQDDYYKNGAKSLKKKDHTIKFTNPRSAHDNDSSEGKDQTSIVQHSYKYVDGHAGWNDPYVLFDYNPTASDGRLDAKSVTFRLMIGKKQSYPVFASVEGNSPYRDAGTILLNWQGSEDADQPHLYARTLLDLPESDLKGAKRKLASGVAVLQELKQAEDIKKGQIHDLRIGYKMDYPPDLNTLVFTPKWYVLYGKQDHERWKSVNELIDLDETNDHAGEEDTG